MTAIYDLGWLILFIVILPLWIVVGLGTLVIVVLRHLYGWARGHATALSRQQPVRRLRRFLTQ